MRNPQFNLPDVDVQLSELQLYSCEKQLVVQTASNPGGNRPFPCEGPLSAIDNDVETKWLDRIERDENGLPLILEFRPLILEFESSVSINQYLWYTANDVPARDPTNWTLEGSDDKDDETSWTMIDDRSGTDQTVPVDRFAPVVV